MKSFNKIIIVTGILILAIIFAIVPLSLSAQELYNLNIQNLRLRMDGVFAQIDTEDQQPKIVDGRVLLPLCVIMAESEFEVDWNEYTQTASLITPSYTILVQMASDSMVVNGNIVSLDVTAQITNDRIMIPVRAIYEAAGAEVFWDYANFTVDIITNHNRIAFHNWPMNSSNWPEHLTPHVPGSITLHLDEAFGSLVDISAPLQFRAIFYHIPGEILDLVDFAEASDWLREVGKDYLETMTLARFVKHFNISREDFELAISLMKERSIARGDDPRDEFSEIPNPDIIFTFDDDIIRYFYRRQ